MKKDIVKRVIISEKGSALQEGNRFMLEVESSANKVEIREAVEKAFGVHVLAVNTQNYGGTTRMLRNRRTVTSSGWKRAIVTLKAGERIEAV